MQTFSKGFPTSELKTVGDSSTRVILIRFKPDPEIFVTPYFDVETLKDRLRYTSFLNPGLKIKFTDERQMQKEELEFFSEKGLIDFVDYLNKDTEAITPTIHFKKQINSTTVEVAIQYNKQYDEKIEAFVNDIRTPEGGTHVIGFRSGCSRAVIG